MIYLDTETCGLHGPAVLIQYAINDSDVVLFEPFKSSIRETINLIEFFTQEIVCGFNLTFDWFHICQLYTTLKLLKVGDNKLPIDYINEYAELEPLARDGPCIKPKSAFDIMLHARKGPYQSTMDRKDIRIRKVPSDLAMPLAKELDKKIGRAHV